VDTVANVALQGLYKRRHRVSRWLVAMGYPAGWTRSIQRRHRKHRLPRVISVGHLVCHSQPMHSRRRWGRGGEGGGGGRRELCYHSAGPPTRLMSTLTPASSPGFTRRRRTSAEASIMASSRISRTKVTMALHVSPSPPRLLTLTPCRRAQPKCIFVPKFKAP
jgi:hypothetical protein